MAYNFKAALDSGLTPQDITNYLASQGRQAEAEEHFGLDKGFLSDVRKDIEKRGDKMVESLAAGMRGEQNPLRTGFQVLGQGAGFGTDLIGRGLSAATPDVIAQPLMQGLQAGAKAVMNTQTAQDLYSGYQTWKEQNPAAARDLEATVNIASLIPTIKGAEAVGRFAKSTGQKLASNASSLLPKGNIGAPADAIGEGIYKVGAKIQDNALRPSQIDIKDGFKMENVLKYDVGGSSADIIAKTNSRMNVLSEQLTEVLARQANKPVVDLNAVYKDTARRLSNSRASEFGQNTRISSALKQLKAEIKNVAGPGKVDLPTAQTIKRASGLQGAWKYNAPDPDSLASETVYNAFYSTLKNRIEDASGFADEVKAINRQLSELIPIHNAAVRRLPIEQRNALISLTDAIGLYASIGDPQALLLVGINKASKSGRVGNALMKAGQSIKIRTPKP